MTRTKVFYCSSRKHLEKTKNGVMREENELFKVWQLLIITVFIGIEIVEARTFHFGIGSSAHHTGHHSRWHPPGHSRHSTGHAGHTSGHTTGHTAATETSHL